MARYLKYGIGMIAPEEVTLRNLGYGGSLRHDESLVYRFVNRAGQCIYVGYTSSPLNRWQAHRRNPWWGEVEAIYYIAGLPDLVARRLEVEAIRTEKPKYNRTVKR